MSTNQQQQQVFTENLFAGSVAIITGIPQPQPARFVSLRNALLQAAAAALDSAFPNLWRRWARTSSSLGAEKMLWLSLLRPYEAAAGSRRTCLVMFAALQHANMLWRV